MFRRSLTSVAAVAATLTLVMAGCSSGGSSSGPTTPGGQTTINFWTWNPDQKTAIPYIEAFQKANPTITVEHRFIQYSDYVSTVQLALQSGSGPDVFGVQVGALTTQFAPLALDLSDAAKTKLGSDWQKKLIATDQLTSNGKQVALPWMITGGGTVWANQTLVDSLGLVVPQKYGELKPFCDKVRAAGKICIVQGAKDAWQNIDAYQAIANQIDKGAFYDALAQKEKFDSPTFVKAFEVWKSFFTDGIFDTGALGMTAYPDANDTMKKGGAALMINGTWQNADTTNARMATYKTTYGDAFNTDTKFMPYFFPQVVENGTTGTLFGGPDVGFAVASSSKNKDAATTFATWLTASTEAQTMMAKTVQQPALASVPIDTSDVISQAQKDAMAAISPQLATLVGQREIANADVKTALGDALSAVGSGQQTPAAAATAVQKAIDAAK